MVNSIAQHLYFDPEILPRDVFDPIIQKTTEKGLSLYCCKTWLTIRQLSNDVGKIRVVFDLTYNKAVVFEPIESEKTW